MVYAVIDAANTVVNLVEWDGESAWVPPEGHTVEPVPDRASIGWFYENGTFTPPPESQE